MFCGKSLKFFTKKSPIILLVLCFLTYLCNTYSKKGTLCPDICAEKIENK
jgi:hypothetical protein